MTTGQYPKKRETDEQEEKRSRKLEERMDEQGFDYRDKYKHKVYVKKSEREDSDTTNL